jgi:hypothetical protein
MATFFIIFFALVLINTALLSFSLVANRRKQSDIGKESSGDSGVNVYPLDLSSSDYRNAI